MPAASEHQLQAAVVRWARLQVSVLPALAALFAVPNGARTSMGTAAKLSAEGMSPGVPDLAIPLPVAGGPTGLWIEMKTPTGRVSPEQLAWHAVLSEAGHRVVVCRSSEAAIAELRAYARAVQAEASPEVISALRRLSAAFLQKKTGSRRNTAPRQGTTQKESHE